MYFLVLALGLIDICSGRALIAAKTIGQPWPMPMSYAPTPVLINVPKSLEIESTGNDCDILQAALVRYYKLTFNPSSVDDTLKWSTMPQLTTLNVNVMSPCEKYPSLGMDESCE